MITQSKKNPFILYISKITFFSIAVCFLIMLMYMFVSDKDYLHTAPYYIMMYYVVTMCAYATVYFLPKHNILKFEQAYMIAQLGKFIIYILIFILVLSIGIEKNIKFAPAYLVLFLIYQIFDTLTLMKLVKQNKKDKGKNAE